MCKVKDCLSGKVIATHRGTPLKDIIKFFKENNFHTLPIVDEDNRLVGKITLDEITSVFQPHSPEINQILKTIPFIDELPAAEIDIENITPEMGILVVADEIMSKNYFTMGPDDSIAKAYLMMKSNNTKLLMVIENEKLVGIIGLFDIIYAIFKEKGVID